MSVESFILLSTNGTKGKKMTRKSQKGSFGMAKLRQSLFLFFISFGLDIKLDGLMQSGLSIEMVTKSTSLFFCKC